MSEDEAANDYTERLWRCSCGDDHFLCLTEWLDGTGDIHLGGHFRCSGWFKRLRLALRLLHHGHANCWVEVVLDRDIALQVSDALRGFGSPDEVQVELPGTPHWHATGNPTTGMLS